MSKVIVNTRFGRTFGANGEYKVITSAEMTKRGSKEDSRFGICFAIEETANGCRYSTHEYNAERDDYYYWGHYFEQNEVAAWRDYYKRSQELLDYIQKWDEIKEA